jgi:hypothetical protein
MINQNKKKGKKKKKKKRIILITHHTAVDISPDDKQTNEQKNSIFSTSNGTTKAK